MPAILSFDPKVAKVYGVDAAIVLFHFHFWIECNVNGDRNFHEGKTWTYHSQKELSRLFDFWSRDQIQRILNKLCSDEGPLVKGNFNKSSYDRTQWYAFKDEYKWFPDLKDILALRESAQCIVLNHTMDNAESRNGLSKIAQPIPDSKPDSSPLSPPKGSPFPPKVKENTPPPPEGESPKQNRASEKIAFDASARSFSGIKEEDRKGWKEAFPGVNIDQELKIAVEWLLSNPTKNPKSNARAFLTRWFTRSQNNAAFSSSRTSNFTKPSAGPKVSNTGQYDGLF